MGEKRTEATGLLIKRKREELGWTQDQLAEQLETTAASINRYENGRRKITLDLLYHFAEVFNVPPAALMEQADGLSCEERQLIEWMRGHPRDRAVIRGAWKALQESQTKAHIDD